MLRLRLDALQDLGDLVADLLGLLAHDTTSPLALLLELYELRLQRVAQCR